MYHRRGDELEGVVLADGQGVTVFYGQRVRERLSGIELAQELESHGGGYDGGLRVFLQEGRYAAGMVRLHMMDHQIVRLAAAQGILQVLHPFPGFTGIYGVHHGHPGIQDDIGVIGDSFREDILAFEQVEIYIVYADITDSVGYFFHFSVL